MSLVLAIVLAGASWCGEKPTADAPRSVGGPSNGKLVGGVALEDSATVRTLPRRHRDRCLHFGVPRLVKALEKAGAEIQRPPLGVGDLSRAQGGPIHPISKSHQAGRDVDLAFYLLDAQGKPVAADDLVHFDDDGRERDGTRRFDVGRNWRLVAALLSDPTIDVRWLFVSAGLKALLLAEGKRAGAGKGLLAQAEAALHQPSDAPPHDDHFHLRIRCTPAEAKDGCR